MVVGNRCRRHFSSFWVSSGRSSSSSSRPLASGPGGRALCHRVAPSSSSAACLMVLLFFMAIICGCHSKAVVDSESLVAPPEPQPQSYAPPLSNKKFQLSRSLFKAENCKYEIALNGTTMDDDTDTADYVHSPGFPERYANDLECRWTITAPNGHRILISLVEGKLEQSKDCTYDYLELSDGHRAATSNVTIGRFCGRLERRSYLSTSNSVLIAFSTDSTFSESGFKLKYALEKRHNFSENCNYTIVAENGTVLSPGFGERRTAKCDCWIQVENPTDNRIKLKFDVVSLRASPGCVDDYVEVFDGSTLDDDVLGTFCGRNPSKEPVVLVSSGRQILLHFRTTGSADNFHGFSLSFSNFAKRLDNAEPLVQKCPMVGTNVSGVLTSPNHPDSYPPDTECQAILEAPEAHHYVVTFEEFDLEPDDLCAFDYIEIKDGPSSDSPSIVQVCGRKANGYAVASSGNAIFVQFKSDEFMEFGGFKATYGAVAAASSIGIDRVHESDDYEIVEDNRNSDADADAEADADADEAKFEGAEWLSYEKKHDGVAPPLIFAHPTNASVALGDTHYLHCFVNGSNSAVIWLKDHAFISRDVEEYVVILANNTLAIRYMNAETEGLYTCVVLTELGALAFSAWVALVMPRPPSTTHTPDAGDCIIDFKQKPSDVAVVQGDDAFLGCHAHDADVYWSKDDAELLPDANVHFLTDNIVVLGGVRVNDSGVYACQAVSKTSGCTKTVEARVHVVAYQDSSQACGRPKWNDTDKDFGGGRGRVASGHTVERGFFPWQAMMWERWAGSFCGGSLLTDRWVITAAHCVTEFHQRFGRTLKSEYLIVRLGKHDQTRAESDERSIGAAKIIVHPRFDSSTYDNDVALVQLSEAVVFTDYILPVCLPPNDADTDFEGDVIEDGGGGTIGAVTGWGMVAERGTSPVHLQVVYVPIVGRQACRASTRYRVTENMFCAGYDKPIAGDACHGDSGGPFTVSRDGRWSLVGLVSWGEGCDRHGKYGFYTKIINFTSWIRTIVAGSRISTKERTGTGTGTGATCSTTPSTNKRKRIKPGC